MKKLLRYFLLLLTLMFFDNIYAQDRTVTGKITSIEDGQPLNGVSVLVVGTNIGTTTTAEGNFTIRVPKGRTQLEFDHVGYTTNRVSVSGSSNVTVKLAQDVKQLTDVVVVGYGSQKKSDITGAISSIKGSDLTQLSTQRVDQALQGRASGVYVLNTAGAPGADATIRVRGMNSINGGDNGPHLIYWVQGGRPRFPNPKRV